MLVIKGECVWWCASAFMWKERVNVLTLSLMLFCFPFNIIITCRNSCFFQNNLEIFSENNCQFCPTKEFSFWMYRDLFTLSLNCSLTSAVASVSFLKGWLLKTSISIYLVVMHAFFPNCMEWQWWEFLFYATSLQWQLDFPTVLLGLIPGFRSKWSPINYSLPEPCMALIIVTVLGWKGPWGPSCSSSPAMGGDTFHWSRLLQGLSNPALNTSRDICKAETYSRIYLVL